MRECPKCELCYPDEFQFCPQDQAQTRHALPGGMLLAKRYLLEKRLGSGAMGRVYLARDENIGKKVAVKTVRQDLLNSDDLQEGEAIARFEREARAAASIRHPHCVDVTDFGKTEDGVFYLVMEYVEGETLHRLLRREGTLNVGRAINLLKQIAEGVDAAHEAGILHRDLKPANIFIMKKRKSGDDGFIKVGDFGLAKIVSQTVTDISSNQTPSSRGIIGTPEFMAPEQMQPELGIDIRADIYAIGTIAYLMLAGKTPFTGDMMQLVMQKIMQVPPALSSVRGDIPFSVEKSIMHTLEREANKRPNTVSDWITELERAARSVSEASPIGNTKLTIMAPVGAEVYLNDERKGNIGSTEKLVLSSIPPGRHILRVSRAGEKDDEREIEIREGANEQVIHSILKPIPNGSQTSSSHGSGRTESIHQTVLPGIVACTRCGARFAEGAKFCGRCQNTTFVPIGGGNPVATDFPCPRCSTKLPSFTKFCGRCGLNMVQNKTIHTSQPPSNPPSHQSQPPPIQPPVQPPTNQPTIRGLYSGNGQSNIPKPVERVCRRCGTTFAPNIKFCGRCGLTLVS